MSKESLSSHQAQAKRIDFIEKMVAEGVLDKTAISERDQNIGLVYILNEEIKGREVGAIFPNPQGKSLSRARVRQISKNLLIESRGKSSPELQSSHPLAELLMRRPIALSPKNAKILSIAQKEDLGSRRHQKHTAQTRVFLAKHGVEIPPTPKPYDDFKAKIETASNYKKLQEILDSYSRQSLEYFMNRHGKDVIMMLRDVIKLGEFHAFQSLSLFAKTIKKKHIPIKISSWKIYDRKMQKTVLVYSYIVYTQHKERITKAFNGNPELQKFKENPVKLVCGTLDGEIPTTTAFRPKRQQYSSVGLIIQEVTGHRFPYKGESVENFLKDCPVQVFKYKIARYGTFRYFVSAKRACDLKRFLESRQSESRQLEA